MGRSGIKIYDNGLRVAYLSGKDNDLFEKSSFSDHSKLDNSYTGNYFTQKDISGLLNPEETDQSS